MHTRPRDQSDNLARLIELHGGTPIVFPLIEVVPIDDYTQFDHTIQNLDDYNLAIFISTNAVQYAMPRILNYFPVLPKSMNLAAIGPMTANKLNEFGIQNIIVPTMRFDSESLLALPEMQNLTNKRIIIVRGLGGRELLANRVEEQGAIVDFAECYKRINPQKDKDTLFVMWQNKKLDALVVTSSEAMRNLLDLLPLKSNAWLKEIILFVNNARIAEQPGVSGLNIFVAGAPGDESMVECLNKNLGAR